eukprot:CAMPEP_0203872580 /NCGR_PEP_ID=MMETSP0359-20131031/19317_1 /ASSEMBLY_ACC=CAM_ASM_000338 /TAXON_ID=268821 /ORGANISM="Scrippsiella Hangoei, Strain SHTV-5" /LENGTH=258 /DNA_ID=CAMNT_0050791269 /DNA_START=55 /DNA_END=831 /DNA_ORIENTATION=+
MGAALASIAALPRRYPLAINCVVLAGQLAAPSVLDLLGVPKDQGDAVSSSARAAAADDDAAAAIGPWPPELVALTVASVCTLLTWPGLTWVEGAALRSFMKILVMLVSACCLGLCWYNAFQDDYFMENCYQAGWKRACWSPRYHWYDAVYDLAFRERCMMARMHDPTSLSVKERQCYGVFNVRWPQCVKMASQCLMAAVVIGGIAVMDSSPLVDAQKDENIILAEARGQERVQENSYGQDNRATASLCDSGGAGDDDD